jgi:DNA repair protein RadD
MLRDYQDRMVKKAIQYIKKTTEPGVLEAPTGSGKSHVIAAISQLFTTKIAPHRRVLVIAPRAELVIQNHEKFTKNGFQASILSSTAGSKDTSKTVIFATPGTAKNKLPENVGLVIVDECHNTSSMIRNIIYSLRSKNEYLRVIGFTATPFRMNTGVIYEIDEDNQIANEKSEKINLDYKKLICRVSQDELVKNGYLAPAITDNPEEQYDTSELRARKANFDTKDAEKACVGRGRLTSRIVEQIIKKTKLRSSVIIFAVNRAHAYEVLESLPKDISEVIVGNTPREERESIIDRFKKYKIKYLINVQVLTLGFDAPNIDVIAIMRPTSSAALIMQMIGRGRRLNDNKEDCLVLDFAENIENHFNQQNLLKPVSSKPSVKDKKHIEARCELCQKLNIFTKRDNPDGYEIDQYGYFVDIYGKRTPEQMPAHYGRRCKNYNLINGQFERCNGRWTFKNCHKCNAENDIAARNCTHCNAELHDPNKDLRSFHTTFARETEQRKQIAQVFYWHYEQSVSRNGNEMYVVDFYTHSGTIRGYFVTKHENPYATKKYKKLKKATKNMTELPNTISYYYDNETGLHRIVDFNEKIHAET